MAAKLTRLTHKIAVQLHLMAECCTICSSRSRRPVRKLLDTPLYFVPSAFTPRPISLPHSNSLCVPFNLNPSWFSRLLFMAFPKGKLKVMTIKHILVTEHSEQEMHQTSIYCRFRSHTHFNYHKAFHEYTQLIEDIVQYFSPWMSDKLSRSL
jgi:hypothetical protein